MKARITSIVVLVVVAVGAAWAISLIKVPNPPQVTHILGGTQKGSDYVYTEGDQYYSIEIHYPAQVALSGQAAVAAQTHLEQGLKTQLDDFKQVLSESLTADEKARLAQYGGTYAFEMQYAPFSSSHYVSYLYDIYEDTGGAHPNANYLTFVFSRDDGHEVALSELFKSGSDYLGRLSQAATVQVRQQVTQRIGADAISAIFNDGLTPKAENFQNFTIDGDTLHIYFPPYQVAAYAAGGFDISIPLSSLSDIVAPNVR